MTEAQWLTCRTPQKMLDFLRGRLTERKLRLIGCSCCRDQWEQFTTVECRCAVEVAELIADGVASEEEIAAGFRLADYARNMSTGTVAGIPRRYKTREARCAAWAVYELVVSLDPEFGGYHEVLHQCISSALEYLTEIRSCPSAERLCQARVIRDIVGNPFRSISVKAAWRTSDAVLLASGIYDERAFDRMPILADALQDAGCDSDELLNHCRDTSVSHVRGCWAIDHVLGKE